MNLGRSLRRMTCRAGIAIAACAALPAGAAAQPASGPQQSRPVIVDGHLVRETVTLGKMVLPAWRVELTYVNRSDAPWELGETLLFIAPSSLGASAGVYIARAPSDPAKVPKRIGDRYRMTWGINVPATGSALWPFTSIRGMNQLDALIYTVQAGSVAALPGGGFGVPLRPGETRTIVEKVVFPFDAEAKGIREAVVIVPPVVRPAGSGPRPAPAFLVFDVRGIVEPGTAFKARSTEVLPDDLAGLRGAANDGTQPGWRRLLALNFLAETYPADAADPLIALAGDTSPTSVVRAPAILNLGLAKVPGALPVLQNLVKTATGTPRLAAIAAIGDFGDPSAAPAIRELLVDKEDTAAILAIRAVGALKDLESLPLLSTIMHGSRRTLYPVAGAALVAMDSQAARDILLNIARNRRSPKPTREAAIFALGEAKASWSTPAVVAVALDEQDDDDVRVAAVQALRFNRSEEREPALQKATSSRKKKVRDAATSALTAIKKAGAAAEAAAEEPGL